MIRTIQIGLTLGAALVAPVAFAAPPSPQTGLASAGVSVLPKNQTCVCHHDPYCCDTSWDSLCVAQAPAFGFGL